MDFIKKYTSHEEYEVNKTPNVSLCIEDNETKHLHYTKKRFDDEYLTFEALESGTFTLTIGSSVTTGDVVSVSYSLDNGETWTTTNNVDGQKVTITTPTVNAGDEVLWKGNAVRMANSTNQNSISTFSSTANFNARGNVMSLLYGDEFKDKVSLSGKDYCFCYLFNNNIKLINGKNISLPATTLSNSCYRNMFRDCASIAKTPELPATTLAEYCYGFMFYGCTSIKVVSELPATTLASYCYRGMFYNCTSLTTAPELPATTLANYCYNSMFYGCTSLTTAPKLPATILAECCYYDMFRGCSNLIVASEISATTLAKSCCYEMFSGCTSLTVAPELPATTLASMCYYYMFAGCTSLTVAPELPATTLVYECYYSMFYGCTNLMKGPELPATTLNYRCYDFMFYGTNVLPDTSSIDFSSETIACSGGLAGLFAGTKITDEDLNRILPKDNNDKYCLPVTSLSGYSCYNSMFEDCVNLKTAPELPATTLSDEGCYGYMFKGCTSLTTAPRVLPATTLASMCYSHMFEGCTSLTKAPELPATTLVDRCYGSMFYGCTSLNSITCLATDISAYDSKDDWVKGVASSGTFIKAGGMNKWTRGSNGIPTNWTVRDYSTISTSLVMYVDDFPEDRLEGESKETVMARQLNSSDECNIGNKYVYTGETITYNGNTYYLWEMSDNCDISSNVVYLLTTTDNFSTLYAQSLEDGLTNHFTSFAGRLDEDKEGMYNDGEIGSERELYIVKIIDNSPRSLRLWFDDFVDGDEYQTMTDRANAWKYDDVDEYIKDVVADPETFGSNAYIYTGETMEYNGTTYYLWERDLDNGAPLYILTTTVDFNTLYDNSLEADHTNEYCPYYATLNPDKTIYFTSSQNNRNWLIKIERI